MFEDLISGATAQKIVRAYHKNRSWVFLKKVSNFIKAASNNGESFLLFEESFTLREDRQQLPQLFATLLREKDYKVLILPSKKVYPEKKFYEFSINWEP